MNEIITINNFYDVASILEALKPIDSYIENFVEDNSYKYNVLCEKIDFYLNEIEEFLFGNELLNPISMRNAIFRKYLYWDYLHCDITFDELISGLSNYSKSKKLQSYLNQKIKIEVDLKNYFNNHLNIKILKKCIYPNCKEGSIIKHCHNIQEEGALRKLDICCEEDMFSLEEYEYYKGHIITIKSKDGISFQIGREGISASATKFYGFCELHDSKVFNPIEQIFF